MRAISERKASSIFISYRVADTLYIADRLACELRRTFGAGKVFFDHRTLEPGDTWDNNIEAAVKGAAVVLVLIGNRWLTEQNAHGRRRLDVPSDWVRRELETALESVEFVLPVFVDDAPPPPREAFDDVPSIVALSSRQGALLRTKDWDTDVSALVKRLIKIGLVAEVGRAKSSESNPTSDSTPFGHRAATPDELLSPEKALSSLHDMGVPYTSASFVESAGLDDPISLKLVDLFLTTGMDPDTENNDGMTAGTKATWKGNFGVVERLTQVNADIERPFQVACSGGQMRIFELGV